MTAEELDEIAARVVDATPGPWCAALHDDTHAMTVVEPCSFGWFGEWDWGSEVHQTQIHADAVFIAHAREDIPHLLAEIARLRGEVRKMA